MSAARKVFVIYDGRANEDRFKASVLDVIEDGTLEDAIRSAREHGDGVVYEYDGVDGKLLNARHCFSC